MARHDWESVGYYPGNDPRNMVSEPCRRCRLCGAWQQLEVDWSNAWMRRSWAKKTWRPLAGRCPGKLPARERVRREREFRTAE